MNKQPHAYACIDLKSFYASVECADRGLDPFTTNLVVADKSRGDGTICLALSPALKAKGLPGRCRLYEIPRELDVVVARPRMKRYMEVSACVVDTYLTFVAPADLHVYSIDECFMDLAPYLRLYRTSAPELANIIMRAVYKKTHMIATAGLGPNLFLAKVALDLFAKHTPSRIFSLDEPRFRELVWPWRPITDIWQIGRGIARRLKNHNIQTLGDVARANPEELYQEFGAPAEYLIDHAWGLEPCTIQEIQRYVPKAHSLSNGQVLPRPYTASEARRALIEMVQESALELTKKRQLATSASLYVGYAWQEVPRPSVHVSRKLALPTQLTSELVDLLLQLFDERTDGTLCIRRLGISFGCMREKDARDVPLTYNAVTRTKEHARQTAMLSINARFGSCAVMYGSNCLPESRGRERAHLVGGHHE